MKRRYPFCLLALLVLMVERPARAYGDPGSGILLWQGIASGFVAVLFYWRKIVKWVLRKRGSQD